MWISVSPTARHERRGWSRRFSRVTGMRTGGSVSVRIKVTPASGGGYILEETVSQDPATFKKFFSLPLRIYFSKGRVANQVVRIGQPQQEFKFKLPENPKKVTVDEDNDLLAEIIIDK